MKGMGRVFKRGPAWWVAYYHRGKEYRESSGSEKEAGAWKLLKKRLGEIGRGGFIGPAEEKVTFTGMAEDILNDYRVNGKRSLRSVTLSKSHLEAFFGYDRAIDITTDRARVYIKQRQEDGAASASINRELSALKRMFTLQVQAGKLSSKPHIPMLEEHNARQGFIDHGAFLALHAEFPEYLKDPVTFLYLSAWRVSEMRAFEWRDVDPVAKVARLRPEISKNKDGRVLPLTGELAEIIERARSNRRLDCVYVFHLDGEPVGDFRKAWHNACVAAGLGRFEESEGSKVYRGLLIHDLRRSAVRNMVRAGIPERVAMSLSGHKTRSVFDRYNIVSEADLTEASSKLQAHLKVQAGKVKRIKKAG